MITKWSELPIGKLMEIEKIDDSDELAAAIKINAILAGVTEDEILQLPLATVAEMTKKRAFMEKRPPLHLPKKKHNLGGTTYIFDAEPQRITTGQFIDFMALEEGDFVGALSIFLIPEGHTYNKGYDIEKAKDDIKLYLSAEEGFCMSGFFQELLALYWRRAVRKAKRLIRKAKRQGIPTQEAEELLKLASESFTLGSR